MGAWFSQPPTAHQINNPLDVSSNIGARGTASGHPSNMASSHPPRRHSAYEHHSPLPNPVYNISPNDQLNRVPVPPARRSTYDPATPLSSPTHVMAHTATLNQTRGGSPDVPKAIHPAAGHHHGRGQPLGSPLVDGAQDLSHGSQDQGLVGLPQGTHMDGACGPPCQNMSRSDATKGALNDTAELPPDQALAAEACYDNELYDR